MILGQRVVVVFPAYDAAQTLERTYRDLPLDLVDDVLVVDDASADDTVRVARDLGLKVFIHERNRGYGGNQKTCYQQALNARADIVVMVHPDYQYDPRLVTSMAAMIACGVYDVVIGSRILGGTARSGGMPRYKYFFNRCLTFAQNLLMGAKLSEYHTGYRAFSRQVLEQLPLLANSDDFIFDNQMLAQALAMQFRIGEVSCPTRYLSDSSSISFVRSTVYGLGVLATSLLYRLWKWRLAKPRIFDERSPELRLQPASAKPEAGNGSEQAVA